MTGYGDQYQYGAKKFHHSVFFNFNYIKIKLSTVRTIGFNIVPKGLVLVV